MAYLYPYGDSQQLNLSWFLAKFKELYEYVMNLDPGESSMDVILSRFTDQYDPSTTYTAGDYCIFDGYIYKANRATSGMFDSGSWDPALPVNDIQGLRILISQLSQTVEDLGEDAVTDVQYTPGAATADGLLRKTINGAASTVMTVDKEPTENSQNPVKSGSVYEELTELQGSLNTIQNAIAIVSNNNTHPAIESFQYVYVKNHSTLAEGLYRATQAIPLNGALSTTNLTAINDGLDRFAFATVTGSITLAGGSRSDLSINAEKSGHILRGIMTVQPIGTQVMAIHGFYTSGNYAVLILENTFDQERTGTFDVRVLYEKV